MRTGHVVPEDLRGFPVQVDRVAAPQDPDAQTYATVIRMASIVDRAAVHPSVRQAVVEALTGLEDAEPRRQAEALYWWVKRRVRFVQDPVQDELLIEPPVLLALDDPRGDCDDFSMLLAAMLRAVGIPYDFITVAGDRNDPQRFSHVYVRAVLTDGPLVLDASHGNEPGWEAEQHGTVYRKQSCSTDGLVVCRPEGFGAVPSLSGVPGTIFDRPAETALLALVLLLGGTWITTSR